MCDQKPCSDARFFTFGLGQCTFFLVLLTDFAEVFRGVLAVV
jgi:hypothetical protein